MMLGEIPSNPFMKWEPSYLVSPANLTSAIPYEGLFFDPFMYQQAGKYLPFPPQGGCPPEMRPFTTKKSFTQPLGYPDDAWDEKGCIARDVSPEPPTWGEGGCPAGTIEYAPWARIPFEIGRVTPGVGPRWPGDIPSPGSKTRDFRACKTRAQLCAEAIPSPSVLKAYPLCKGWPGPDPDVSWVTGKASDCGPNVSDTPRLATAPCPPGFEKYSEHKEGPFFMCRETPATHAMRVAAWRAGCPTAVIAEAPKPLEEVSSEADLPEEVKEHFVPEPIATPAAVISIGGLEIPAYAALVVGALAALLVFRGRR